MEGDIDTALELYGKIRFMYLAMGQLEKADEIQIMIESLNKGDLKGALADGGESRTQKGPGETEVPGGTNANGKEDAGKVAQNPGPGVEQTGEQERGREMYGEPLTEPGEAVSLAQTRAALQEAALRQVAEGDLNRAIELYQQIKQSYEDSGNTDLAEMTQETITQLRSLQRESQGPGGEFDG